MPYNILFLLKDLVIVLLIFAVVGLVRKIRALQETLADERRKRSMPFLTVEVNTENDFGVFLINDSYCYARNIRMDDLDVIVDYGFKKHIRLKFDPLETLKPNGRSRLNYRVFDGEFDTTATDATNILNHFQDAPITMHLYFENLEGGPFASTIVAEKNQYIVKEVVPIKEESR
ncbi:MAG TPA: hypothetical protein PKV41_06355 [Candidatus Omnitrophota bacterium]|nr:hypothetical protein [Candidatus Omnitrophota bacterium]